MKGAGSTPVASSKAMTMKFLIPDPRTASIHVASMPYLPSSDMSAELDTGRIG